MLSNFLDINSKYFRQRVTFLNYQKKISDFIKANLSEIYFQALKSKNSDNSCIGIFRNFLQCIDK